MATRSAHRTIMGIGIVDLPEELRSTLVDAASAPVPEESATGYGAWLGREYGGYRLDALIAEGGMGAVFQASPVGGGRPVAFKVMHAELGADDAIRQRFLREVEIGRRLKHENVVGVLDTGTTPDGSPFLVLELVVGPTLAHAMWSEGAFEWRRAVRIAAQIAAAIGAAWDAGFVHRDLKPDNVVLEPRGPDGERVMLLDFGIAHDRSVAGLNAKLTVTGQVLGTAGYMAPEQCVGQGVDVRADLYALGVILWEMLAGFPLFDEGIEAREYLLAQMRLNPTPPSELAPGSPPELTALVTSLLKHLAQDRPGDPWAVRDELLRTLAPPSPMVTDAPAAPPIAPPPPPPAPAPPIVAPRTASPASRHLVLFAGVGLALFGALTCGVAAALLLLR